MAIPNPNAPACQCGVLESLSKRPQTPIAFDAKMNEYHIVGSDGGLTMIYHCPICGGRTPESRRASFFKNVTDEETARLTTLCAPFKTLSELLSAWGAPDFDRAEGMRIRLKDADGAEQTLCFRKLTFAGHSSSANVEVIVLPDDQVRFEFWPKGIDQG